MSLSGFMKQINKANQIINEKIGGAKGTEIDHQYQAMEKVSLTKLKTLPFISIESQFHRRKPIHSIN